MLGTWLISGLMALAGAGARSAMYCGNLSHEKLNLSVSAPSVEGTVTRLDYSWFNLEQDGTAPIFFTAHLCNGNEVPARLRMIVAIQVTPTDPQLAARCGSGGCWAEEQITKVLEIPANSSRTISSRDLLSSSYEPGGYDPSNAPFRKLLSSLGRLPPSNIRMFFGLTCEENLLKNRLRGRTWTELSEAVAWNHFSPVTIESEYRPIDGVSLLQPGGPEGFPEIWSATPVFSYRSGVSDFRNYGSDTRFRLELWELGAGETQGQALSRRADRSLDLDEPLAAWPSAWAPLRAGARYVWRVGARERGPVSGWLLAEPFGFRVAEATQAAAPSWIDGLEGLDAQQLRLLRLLARVLGPKAGILETAAREGRIDPASLTLDGKPLTVDALERMVPDFESGKDNVIEAGMP